MKVVVDAVAKGRGALPETSTAFETGRARLVVAETEQRPTVLGLVASGRMKTDRGSVTIDGRMDARSLRRRVALVDAPIVSEPESNVSVTGVVAEELMFAGHAPSPFAAARWLEGLGLGGIAGIPLGTVEPATRIRLLLELAALRTDVEGLVLVAPDRHGGEPLAWWRIAEEFADRGYAVLAIAGQASRTAIDAASVGAGITGATAASGPDEAGATAVTSEAETAIEPEASGDTSTTGPDEPEATTGPDKAGPDTTTEEAEQ